MKFRSLVFFTFLALSVTVRARPTSDVLPSGPPAFAGAWWMGHDGEGSQSCLVRLKVAGVIGGYQLRVPRTCRGIVDRYDELFAWFPGPNGTLVFIDAARQAIYRFHNDGDGEWASEGSADERYLLHKIIPRTRRHH